MWHGQLPILTPCHPGEAVEVLETGRLVIYQKFSLKILRTRGIFFTLFTRPEVEVQEWCRTHSLLATIFPCPYDGCEGHRSPKLMARASGGSIYRCSRNRDHTSAFRIYSFFEKSNLQIQDIMLFIKSYLDTCSLAQCARFLGMSYGSTAVNWASFVREMFKEYFYRNLRFRKLQGVIEIDESLFGRRVKFHRGNPSRGLKVN